MKSNLLSEITLISPVLLEQVQAMAAAENRPASEILRDAIELYRHNRGNAVPASSHPSNPRRQLTPQAAVARILELRKGNRLPEGETIKDLINYGRA